MQSTPSDYQCVLATDGLTWHATQEQATPPKAGALSGAYTICALWMEFRRGYARSRPTCSTCLRACEGDEKKRLAAQAKKLGGPRVPRRL